MKYEHVIRAIFERPWAIMPEVWSTIAQVAAMRAAGEQFTEEEIQERLAVAAASQGPRNGGRKVANVEVIPVYGVISPRANLMSRTSGGASVEDIRTQFRTALNDDEIGGIVFDHDSPGGSVEGIEELATEIREARGRKPITAHANHLSASAAYWLAAQADSIGVSPSGTVGSVGVFAAHQDISKAQELAGVKTTFVKAGKYKTEGNAVEPLSEEAHAAIQRDVDEFYGMMAHSIAKGRKVPVDTVRGEAFGEGRLVMAKRAVAQGMADHVETLEQAIRRTGRLAVAGQDGVSAYTDPAVLVSALPFAERLALVAGEVRALVQHSQARAALRAEEGRDLSDATREQLREFLALRDVLDEVEALAAEEAEPQATVNQPRARRILEIYEAARQGGYSI